MVHYINDYFKIQGQYGGLEKRASELEAQLHAIEAAVAHLKQEATTKKKLL